MTDLDSRLGTHFERLATSTLRHPARYVGAVLVCVLLALVSSFPPTVEGDMLRLLPKDDPAANALIDFRRQPGGEGVIALTVPAENDIAELAIRINALPTVKATFHGIEGDPGLKLALLQFSATDLEAFAESIQYAIAFRNPSLVEFPDPPDSPLSGGANVLEDLFKADVTVAAEQVLFVIPEKSAEDLAFSAQFLEEIEQTVPQGTWIAGPHAENASGTREVRRDLARTSLFSLLLVMTVIGIAFRHAGGVFVLVPPIIAANIVALAIVQQLTGAINLYTSIGGAVLFGLGVDFGIHLVSRYREELASGLTAEDAVRRAWAKTGPPCLTAAVTSAAGFLVFLAADFRGLSQLGVLLAIGVILALIFMFVLLPIFLTRISIRPRALHGAGRLPRSLRISCAVIVGAVSTALVLEVPRLSFDYDLGQVRYEGYAWDELSTDQRRYREMGLPPVMIDVDDRTQAHVRFQSLVDEGKLPHVRGVLSLDSVLPPDQPQRLVALQELIKVANHPRRNHLPGGARTALEEIAELDASRLTIDDLPEGLAFLVAAEYERVQLLLQGNLLDLREAHKFATELEPHTDTAVNEFLAAASMYTVFSSDLPRVAALAFVAVLLILILDLRSVRLIAIGGTSLFLGLLWAAGGLAFFDVRINVVNVVALPMLLGIGIDVVVHLLHRLRAGDSVEKTLRMTGIPVLLGTTTTIAAFLALSLAANRGLQSLSFVILIGLTAVFLSAVLLVLATHPSNIGADSH